MKIVKKGKYYIKKKKINSIMNNIMIYYNTDIYVEQNDYLSIKK